MSIAIDRARLILRRFRGKRVLVVGDLMLDRYIYGAVSRISPEAPVPVVHVDREQAVPGGAANVAGNIRALGGQASVSGVLGDDAAGSELRGLLARARIGTGGVVACRATRTIVKTRVLADRQQCVRIDWEDPLQISAAQQRDFLRRITREAARADAVIIEDYDKGVVRQPVVDAVLKVARRRRIPVGLDPKRNEDLRVAGVTFATPNRKEAFISAGMDETPPHADPLKDRRLLEVGRKLMRKWKPQHLMITLGAQGVLLLSRGRGPRHIPTRAREVFDVSGAGDTVIATTALAAAAGADFVEAVEIANYAAGVVVGKLGTATCSQDELLAYMTG